MSIAAESGAGREKLCLFTLSVQISMHILPYQAKFPDGRFGVARVAVVRWFGPLLPWPPRD
jgi:hypothetical protein